MITNLVVTAYCACHLCCGPRATGITASGAKPKQGVTVAASRTIPFGTSVIVEGLTNKFIVQDRLSKKYGDRVDIYFKKHSDAKKFGKRKLKVWIKENH